MTNLDFVELLLQASADLNSQYHSGLTPLMYAIPDASGAANVLLNWPTTDANIISRSGKNFLTRVCSTITDLSD
jgi:ankyrin repeat protein